MALAENNVWDERNEEISIKKSLSLTQPDLTPAARKVRKPKNQKTNKCKKQTNATNKYFKQKLIYHKQCKKQKKTKEKAPSSTWDCPHPGNK